jgi:hypothetical protein
MTPRRMNCSQTWSATPSGAPADVSARGDTDSLWLRNMRICRPAQSKPSSTTGVSAGLSSSPWRSGPTSNAAQALSLDLVPTSIPHDGFPTVLLAVSSYSDTVVIPGLPTDMAPSGPMGTWRGGHTDFDPCSHGNVDNCFYYESSDGGPWQMHSQESPDHVEAIMSASGIEDLAFVYRLPFASSGTVDELRARGACLDFHEPFWSTSRSRGHGRALTSSLFVSLRWETLPPAPVPGPPWLKTTSRIGPRVVAAACEQIV